MRLFYAIPMPVELVGSLQAAQAELKRRMPDPGIRWARPDHYHITLKFLGEEPIARAYQAVDAGRAVAEQAERFTFALGGCGAFPNAQRPSVVWIGARAGGEQIVALGRALDDLLARLRFRRETKPPTAHVTVARTKTYEAEQCVSRAIGAAPQADVGAFVVDGFALMQSVLKPSGSVYSVVERFRFGGAVDSATEADAPASGPDPGPGDA